MLNRIYRKLKYEYYKLLRTKGAPTFIALGFALGMFIEFVTLPTLGIAFLLLLPLAKLFRCSKSSALAGFVAGKLLLPLFFIPIFHIGYVLVGHMTHASGSAPPALGHHWLAWLKENGIAYLTGSAIIGMCTAFASYLLVYFALRWFRHKKARRVWGGQAS